MEKQVPDRTLAEAVREGLMAQAEVAPAGSGVRTSSLRSGAWRSKSGAKDRSIARRRAAEVGGVAAGAAAAALTRPTIRKRTWKAGMPPCVQAATSQRTVALVVASRVPIPKAIRAGTGSLRAVTRRRVCGHGASG